MSYGGVVSFFVAGGGGFAGLFGRGKNGVNPDGIMGWMPEELHHRLTEYPDVMPMLPVHRRKFANRAQEDLEWLEMELNFYMQWHKYGWPREALAAVERAKRILRWR